jgi:hypothetical protein
MSNRNPDRLAHGFAAPMCITYQSWAFTRNFVECLALVRCRWLVNLGAPLPKLLMSTIFICHGSMN